MTLWEVDPQGRYVSWEVLTGEQWQEYVRRHPVQQQAVDYLSDG